MWSFGVHVLLAVLRINNVERERFEFMRQNEGAM